MKRAVLAASALLATGSLAYAASADGNSALALAALVAERSPLVAPADKMLLANYLDGRVDAPHPRGAVITVAAGYVKCRAGNVDIAAWSCELNFGNATIALNGRAAHELFATLTEAGIGSEGAAGSTYEMISRLTCKVSADRVAERGGGGAHCKFDAGG